MFSLLFFFFFKQKTAYEMRISDWSSDVCSSDLVTPGPWRQMPAVMAGSAVRAGGTIAHPHRTSRPRHAATDQPDPADSLDHEGAGQARSGQGHLDGGGPGAAAGPERGPDQAREDGDLQIGKAHV